MEVLKLQMFIPYCTNVCNTFFINHGLYLGYYVRFTSGKMKNGTIFSQPPFKKQQKSVGYVRCRRQLHPSKGQRSFYRISRHSPEIWSTKKLIRHTSVSSLLCQKQTHRSNEFEGFEKAILIFMTNGQFATCGVLYQI